MQYFMNHKSIFIVCFILAALFSSCGGSNISFGTESSGDSDSRIMSDSSGDLDARIISVFRADGDAVRVSNVAGTQTDARSGMGLHAGYAVSTGLDSFCYIRLDADSLVKMDVSTDISVGQVSSNLLRINIDGGQVLVNVQNQAPEHELEAIIGNTVIAVRGTLFVAACRGRYGYEALIIMLDGSVYVNGVLLEAGNTMRMVDGSRMDYIISPTVFSELDGFQLNSIIDNQARLLAAGAVTGSDLDEIRRYAEVQSESEQAGDDEEPEAELIISVGDVIRFGPYDWRVLDMQGDRKFLLSEHVLFYRPYHRTTTNISWEQSDIRSYLNTTFLNSFNSQDQARIAFTNVVNGNNPRYGTAGGNNTTDRIFLLSIEEVWRYFGDDEDLTAKNLQGSASHWWLRSPGDLPCRAAGVLYDGRLAMSHSSVEPGGPFRPDPHPGHGSRPALWIYHGD